MRARSPGLWIFAASLAAMTAATSGCSTSLVPVPDKVAADAGAGPDPATVGADAGTPGAPAAVVYPSPYNAGTYMLELSNAPVDCQNTSPTLACSPAGVTYWVQVQMPPEDLTAGVYLLSDLIYPSFSETGPNDVTPASCWGGFGSFTDGTLEIVSVSTTDLVFQLHDTLTFDFDVDGSPFTAHLCPGVTGAVPTAASAVP